MIGTDQDFQVVHNLIECSKTLDKQEEEWTDKFYFEEDQKQKKEKLVSSRICKTPEKLKKQAISKQSSLNLDQDGFQLLYSKAGDLKLSLRIRKFHKTKKRDQLNQTTDTKIINPKNIYSQSPQGMNVNEDNDDSLQFNKTEISKQYLKNFQRTELKLHKVVARVNDYQFRYSKPKSTNYNYIHQKAASINSSFIQKLKPLNQIYFVKKSKAFNKENSQKNSRDRYNLLGIPAQTIKASRKQKKTDLQNFDQKILSLSLLDINQKLSPKIQFAFHSPLKIKKSQVVKHNSEKSGNLEQKKQLKYINKKLYNPITQSEMKSLISHKLKWDRSQIQQIKRKNNPSLCINVEGFQ